MRPVADKKKPTQRLEGNTALTELTVLCKAIWMQINEEKGNKYDEMSRMHRVQEKLQIQVDMSDYHLFV